MQLYITFFVSVETHENNFTANHQDNFLLNLQIEKLKCFDAKKRVSTTFKSGNIYGINKRWCFGPNRGRFQKLQSREISRELSKIFPGGKVNGFFFRIGLMCGPQTNRAHCLCARVCVCACTKLCGTEQMAKSNFAQINSNDEMQLIPRNNNFHIQKLLCIIQIMR